MSETVEEVEAELESLESGLDAVASRRREVEARLDELGPDDERDSYPSIPPSPMAGATRAILRRIAMWQVVPLLLVHQVLLDATRPWDYLQILSLTCAAAAAVYGFDRWAMKNPDAARKLKERLQQGAPRWWGRRSPKMRVPSPEEQKERKAREKRHRERARWEEDRKQRRKQRGRR